MKKLLLLTLLFSPILWAEDILTELEGKGAEVAVQSVQLKSVFAAATAEQNIFFTFFESAQYEKALYQWFSAFDKTAAGRSDNGRALFGLLLYKNGLKLYGTQVLFEAKNPTELAKDLKKAWVETAIERDPLWKIANVKWTTGWTHVFGPKIESIVRAAQVHPGTNITELQDLIQKAPSKSVEKSWLQWQLALAFALNGDLPKGAKQIRDLLNNPDKQISNDKLHLTAARLLYERGYLDPAIDYYLKVGKNSAEWFEAREEAAWAHLRKGEPQNALGDLQDLLPSYFASQIGPEAIYLKSLAHLKICDYPNVATTLKDFKTRFKPRAENLKALIDAETSQPADAFIEKMKKGEATLKDLGPLANQLPRVLYRDEILRKLVLAQKEHEDEALKSEVLYTRSLTGGTEKVGFNARFGEFKLELAKKAQGARGASFARIRQLASNEYQEITQILQRAHIVEAEMVQQIHLSTKVAEHSANKIDIKKGTVKAQGDTLNFPFDGEVWMDELSNYKVDVQKGCQARKGAG